MGSSRRYETRPIVTPAGRNRRSLARRLARAVRSEWRGAPSDETFGRSGGDAIQGMMIASRDVAPPNEGAIVAGLIESYAAAKDVQRDLTGPYAPGASWKVMLDREWAGLQGAIGRRDVAAVAAFLRNFFRNEGLSGFWGSDRMFEKFAALDGDVGLRRARTMQRQVDAWREFLPAAALADLDAPPIGNPWGYVVDGTLLYEPACEYHLQAHGFATLLRDVAQPVIMEIGGGFGGLAYQILKRMPQASYIGFDLPENMLVQSYYLQCAFPDARVLTYSSNMPHITAEVIRDHDAIILPNFMIPEVEAAQVDLAVNVRSLSEMPMETIAEYLRQIDRIGRHFFFHENIYKDRRDEFWGVPVPAFPAMENFRPLTDSASRWPRYGADTDYPCHEYLLIHKGAHG